MDKSLKRYGKLIKSSANPDSNVVTDYDIRKGPNNQMPTNPAGLASLGGC